MEGILLFICKQFNIKQKHRKKTTTNEKKMGISTPSRFTNEKAKKQIT